MAERSGFQATPELPGTLRARREEEAARVALLVVDLQTDFLDAQGRFPVALDQVAGLLETTNRLIAYGVTEGWEVVYIANEFPASRSRSLGLSGAATKGQPGVELDKRLRVVNSIYFPKSGGDAFHNSALENYLKRAGVTRVMLVGVFANECIRRTASGALKRGYEVWVISDAVADADAQTRARALEAMKVRGVTVVSWKKLVRRETRNVKRET